MRLARVVAGLATVIITSLGLSVTTASPAAAYEDGAWRAFGNTNPVTSSSSTWSCGSTLTIATDMLAQVCEVRTPNGAGVQGAVIVRNNRTTLGPASASVSLYTTEYGGDLLGTWLCPSSGVGARSWSVCFGRTLTRSLPVAVRGYGGAVYLGWA